MKPININQIISVFAFLFGIVVFQSCTEDESPMPVIENVRVVEKDSSITAAGFSDWIAIQGRGFSSIKEVLFNNVKAEINTTLVTDNNIVVAIPGTFPDEITNKIVVITAGGMAEFDFVVEVPEPLILSLSNEFANAGDILTIKGRYMVNVSSVTFPGNVEVTTNIVETEDGTQLDVLVPEGITEAGSILVTTPSGTGDSAPKYRFNDKTGMICNYDDLNKFDDWGKQTVVVEASSDPTNPSPIDGNYIKMQSSDDVAPGSWWVDQSAMPHAGIEMPDYPASDPAANYALKFEFFSVGNFNTGHVQVQFDWGPEYWFQPYLDEDGNEPEEFVSERWQTAVIPLSEFSTVATYANLKDKPSLLFLLRTPEASAPLVGVDINFDNLRVVPIK